MYKRQFNNPSHNLELFDVIDQSITPYFPYTGNWYDLMDEDGETTLNVSSTNDQINLQPGEFKIFGNKFWKLILLYF